MDLGDGVKLDLVRIPAGTLRMGEPGGSEDEQPCDVPIAQPYWMGRLEVTNAQFARFDARHDSRVEDKLTYQFGIHGYPENGPEQPVVRVTWREATAFCAWLSRLSGAKVMLPTEAQWEWACRAGTATPFWWGGPDDDFAKRANLGDAKLRELASNPYTVDEPLPDATKYDDWVPKETRFNDGALVTVKCGSYQPSPWGLYDMHGNAAEWTRTSYRPYPYQENDRRNDLDPEQPKVVRGGSWRDRPFRCTAAYRLAYRTYQPVYNVGFRVVVEP
ncbi:MAG: SUMF1/EgtB/PvdO family nonheme iron enzyme [Armatimonadetes bacterium]|nr:SUMF1/EgtB/PvdO family nonheme iron enzyme [Armatimonadota bacterium]